MSHSHFHSAVCWDREDLIVFWGDADGDDRSRVAFQNTSWFSKIEIESGEKMIVF